MSKTISEIKAAKERLEDQISCLLMKFEEENGVQISDLSIYPREICNEYRENDRSPNWNLNYRQAMKKVVEDAICVKITIYKGVHADKVIYYRNKLPMRIVSQWRWYFEYIAARVKVSNPRRKVELFIGPQTLLQGQEYIDARSITLLRAKESKLKKLQNTAINDDLFSFARQDQDNKMQDVQVEIDALKRGEFNYYVPPEYINTIKEWITPKSEEYEENT